MVYRAYIEKREGFAVHAEGLLQELEGFLGIRGLSGIRVLYRYDIEDIEVDLFDSVKNYILSEPQSDMVHDKTPAYDYAFGVESLPGQFNQRADSVAQCIRLLGGENPLVRTATIILLYGKLEEGELEKIKRHLINPIESREADLSAYRTLRENYELPQETPIMTGFRELDREGCDKFIKQYGLAADVADIEFCRDYFINEERDPTLAEIKVLDTYWSDHCRHTTFNTVLKKVVFEDALAEETYKRYLEIKRELNDNKPVSLMNLATVGAKYLQLRRLLKNVDESAEVNACTVRIQAESDRFREDYLLFFKNETHNHPTEIEPFGGAATCLGGAIRDPLSGRSYVYQAMRVSGGGDPTAPLGATLKGKLPQRTIAVNSANGYSSYGNQIGLATGHVAEIYHEGFVAKRLELGAVVGAVPARNVVRMTPEEGDRVILLGGRTGRDGCGGATGSSKKHTEESVFNCAAEVQRGNPPEERKIQRLFRKGEVTRMIKRCNDFGAGGVAVAVGELADGLTIDLDAIKKKYAGLSVTELAISESQERMAVVVALKDVDRFIREAEKENLEATVIARVTAEKRLVMTSGGVKYVDLARSFLNTNGVQKFAEATVKAPSKAAKELYKVKKRTNREAMERLVGLLGDINCASKKGLVERFDSTVGAGTVVMPFGGKRQLTPAQASVAKLPTFGETNDCTVLTYGYDPFVSSADPFAGAYNAVVESVAKLVASGAHYKNAFLSFQEYFERLGDAPERWGKPFAALLGALKAQLDYSVGAIGGKDSMSGSFNGLDVPPTLVSFAVQVAKAPHIMTPEFKTAGDEVVLFEPEYDERGMSEAVSQKKLFVDLQHMIIKGRVRAVYTTVHGGVAEGLYKCAIGNGFGFKVARGAESKLFGLRYGSFIVELDGKSDGEGFLLGEITEEEKFIIGDEEIEMSTLAKPYEERLSTVYPVKTVSKTPEPLSIFHRVAKKLKGTKMGSPRALITVFPGTNCEYDVEKAFRQSGARSSLFVMKNLTQRHIGESVEEFVRMLSESQILFIPGGFSAGDEPDGSGKFIASFFRNPLVSEAVYEFLEKKYLMGGICNGFQALVRLGLLSNGRISDITRNCPTLTLNEIGRHQSRIVRTRIASNKSPWLRYTKVGEIYSEPISHGEGRFMVSERHFDALMKNGQIATQYCDLAGKPTYDVLHNPNGSFYAIEGITSPDGRIFGKMAHSERVGRGLYKNVDGKYGNYMFAAATDYFR